ncbi:MAG: sporulation protein YqfD [Clostridia bacterium]|nr:sporulation protein YqfD [Clostridia bacterium]
MVLRLVRFIIGYVSFTAKGGFPERFINLCRQNRIDLWNLKSENSVLTACTDVYGYKKIRTCAKKSGMRVRLSRKYGLSFFLDRHSRRIGIIIGALFCAAALMMLSTRIWRIEVIGNDRIPSDAILSVFEELGVRKGAAISSVDEWTVEQAAIR